MSRMWKAYGKHTAFGLERLDVAMGMHLRRFWVESSDEFPVSPRVQVFLPLYDHGFVCPYGVSEMLDICV